MELRVGSTDVESAEGTNWVLLTHARTCVSTLVAKLILIFKYYDDVCLQSEKRINCKIHLKFRSHKSVFVTVDAAIASSSAPSFLCHRFPHYVCRHEPCDVPSCFKHSTVIAVPKEPHHHRVERLQVRCPDVCRCELLRDRRSTTWRTSKDPLLDPLKFAHRANGLVDHQRNALDPPTPRLPRDIWMDPVCGLQLSV